MVNRKNKRGQPPMSNEQDGSSSKKSKDYLQNNDVNQNGENVTSNRVSKCFLCDCVFDDDESIAFACRSCISTNSNPSDDLSTRQTNFCSGCILSHVKRGHDIVDEKGYKASICEDHKNLHSLYCSDCEFLACSDCVLKHIGTGHTLISVKKQACEAKKKVFNYLNTFDCLSKDVKFCQQSHKDITEAVKKSHHEYNSDTFPSMLSKLITDYVLRSTQFEYQFNDSKQLLTAQFRDERAKWTAPNRRNFGDVVKKADQLVAETRELLQSSDGILVQKLNRKRKALDQSIIDQSAEVSNVVCFRPLEVAARNVDNSLHSLVHAFLSNISWPRPVTLPKVTCSLSDGTVLELGSEDLFSLSSECIFICSANENGCVRVTTVPLLRRKCTCGSGLQSRWLIQCSYCHHFRDFTAHIDQKKLYKSLKFGDIKIFAGSQISYNEIALNFCSDKIVCLKVFLDSYGECRNELKSSACDNDGLIVVASDGSFALWSSSRQTFWYENSDIYFRSLPKKSKPSIFVHCSTTGFYGTVCDSNVAYIRYPNYTEVTVPPLRHGLRQIDGLAFVQNQQQRPLIGRKHAKSCKVFLVLWNLRNANLVVCEEVKTKGSQIEWVAKKAIKLQFPSLAEPVDLVSISVGSGNFICLLKNPASVYCINCQTIINTAHC